MPSGSRKLRPEPVGRVDDSTVLNAELVEPGHPRFQVSAGGAAEADMVQANPEFAEALVGRRKLVLVDSEQGVAVENPRPGGGILAAVCSSTTGSASNSPRYQGPLTAMSRTVIATWLSPGNAIPTV